MTVYFLSGMCVNCGVFDKIELPPDCNKQYIEWQLPEKNITLEEYARLIAKNIDSSTPFILVGYSLGGIVMQEMNRFLTPHKNILISSVKSSDEIPFFFRLIRKVGIINYLPRFLFSTNKIISHIFIRLVYNMRGEDIDKYVTYTNPVYMKWATVQIINWLPIEKCRRLFHIHGTKDQVFPYKNLRNVYSIEGGDHLMVLKESEKVNAIINNIILDERVI